MRQAKKVRKKFQTRIPLTLDPGKKIPKKIQKASFRHYFQPKRDEIGREREKKILVPNSVPTRLRQEYSKKNSKKIREIKKPLSGKIPIQNGMRQAEKGRKKFQSRIPFILDPVKKIPKKIARKFKLIKNVFPALFLAKTG